MQRVLDERSDKEILSAKEKRRIAEELSIGPGVFAALCVTAVLFLGLFLLRGSAVWPTAGHSLLATAANVAPPSPRATVAQRFYFDAAAKQQM